MSIYIITFQNKSGSEKDLNVGFLPFSVIPKNSILKIKMFDDDICFEFGELGGIKGIHYDKEYAEEHLKLEKNWRNHDNVWMTEIKEK